MARARRAASTSRSGRAAKASRSTRQAARGADRDRVVAVKVQPLDGADFAARVPGDIAVANQGVRPTDVDGTMAASLCLWRINPLGVRGAPLLLRILDKGDALDRVVTGIANRPNGRRQSTV